MRTVYVKNVGIPDSPVYQAEGLKDYIYPYNSLDDLAKAIVSTDKPRNPRYFQQHDQNPMTPEEFAYLTGRIMKLRKERDERKQNLRLVIDNTRPATS